jgi:uncharacterized membrane protein
MDMKQTLLSKLTSPKTTTPNTTDPTTTTTFDITPSFWEWLKRFWIIVRTMLRPTRCPTFLIAATSFPPCTYTWSARFTSIAWTVVGGIMATVIIGILSKMGVLDAVETIFASYLTVTAISIAITLVALMFNRSPVDGSLPDGGGQQ